MASSARVEHLLSKMESEKFPLEPVCSKCAQTKRQSDFSTTQLKKHAKRTCLACVAQSVDELVAFRNSFLHKEIAQYTSEERVQETLEAALSRRRAKRDRQKHCRVEYRLRALQAKISLCRARLEPLLPRLVHTAESTTPPSVLQDVTRASADASGVDASFDERMLDTRSFYTLHNHAPIPFDARAARLDWDALPAAVDPMRSGGLTEARAVRKRQQVEFMLGFLLGCATPGCVIVDVGCASGNFSLPLAAVLPACTFVLVDWAGVQLAEARAAAARLTNVRVHFGGVQSLPATMSFDVCIAMHACGPASDWAQIQALRRNAVYILCPCCVGKGSQRTIKELGRAEQALLTATDAAGAEVGATALDEPHLQRPRSSWLSGALSTAEFTELAAQADYNAHSEQKSASGVDGGDDGNADSDGDKVDGRAAVAASAKRSKHTEHAGCDADVDDDAGGDDVDNVASRIDGSRSGAVVTTEQLAIRAGLPRYWAACKALLEMDRSAAALERGGAENDGARTPYRVALVKMQPPSASAKNDVLIGVPSGWRAPHADALTHAVAAYFRAAE